MTHRFERVETRYVERRKSDGKFWFNRLGACGWTDDLQCASTYGSHFVKKCPPDSEARPVRFMLVEIEDATEGETNAEH